MSTTAKEANVFTLHTCNYQQFTPTMGTAVQTSIGNPRWPLRYALDFKISELMPSRAMLKLPYGEYADRFQKQLEEVGVEHLGARFQAIASATGEMKIVLLCFEDLAKPGNWCHRRMVAEFWTERTGQPVTELGRTGQPARDGKIDL